MDGAAGTPAQRARKRKGGQEAGHADGNEDQSVRAEAPLSAASPASAAFAISTSSAEPAAASPSDSAGDAAAGSQAQAASTGGVQPLPEQFSQRKKPRRSGRLACNMDRMAAVELQLVLQCLDTESKLAAAQSSRRLLQAADHPFAWAGPKPFAIDSREYDEFGTLISQSLVRNASIALRLGSESDLPLTLAQVALVPRLHELTSLHELHPQLLALPALQGLQSLRLLGTQSGPNLRLLASLPRLHTLRVHGSPSDGDWTWLPTLPALTDLSLLVQSDFAPAHDSIGRCAQLHTLRLCTAGFEPGTFAPFCARPAMIRLRHLEIDGVCDWDRLDADEWRAGLGALAQLKSLRVKRLNPVDLLLPHVAHAPALRTLAVDWRMHVRLQAPASLERWRSSFDYRWGLRMSADAPQQLDEQWHELQRLAGELDSDRVAVAEPEEEE